MTDKVPAIPEGAHCITAYLRIKGAVAAIEYYKQAFGAVEDMRLVYPDGRIAYARLLINDSWLMLSDEHPEFEIYGPATLGNTSCTIHMYVNDVDAVFAQAVEAGAQILNEVKDQFYGSRSGKIRDPFGHEWLIDTQIEEVSEAEMQRRLDQMMAE